MLSLEKTLAWAGILASTTSDDEAGCAYETALGDAFANGFLRPGDDTGMEDALSLNAEKEGISICARDVRFGRVKGSL